MIDSFRVFAQGDFAHFILSTQGCPNRCPWCCQPQTQAMRKPERKLMSLLPQILEKAEGKARKSLLVNGGEPLIHVDELAELGKTLKEQGFILNINTSACVPFSAFEKLVPYFCHFSVDIKHRDNAAHRKVVGSDLGLVMVNLRRLDNLAHVTGQTHLLVRTPLARDFNDDKEVIAKIMDFVEPLPAAKYQVFPVRIPEKAPERNFMLIWDKFRKLEEMARKRMGERYEPYFKTV